MEYWNNGKKKDKNEMMMRKSFGFYGFKPTIPLFKCSNIPAVFVGAEGGI